MNVFTEEERNAGWNAVEKFEEQSASLCNQLKSAFQNAYPIESKENVYGNIRSAIAGLLTLTTESMEVFAAMTNINKTKPTEMMFSELLGRKDLAALGFLFMKYQIQLEPDDEDTTITGLFLITTDLDVVRVLAGDYYHNHIDDQIDGSLDMLDVLGIKYQIVKGDSTVPQELLSKMEQILYHYE